MTENGVSNLFSQEPPDRQALARKLGSALRSYRIHRPRDDGEGIPELQEVFPMWEVPRHGGIADEFHLEFADRWFTQVFLFKEPRYYARCGWSTEREKWRVDWIGEAWLARAVEDGVVYLEEEYPNRESVAEVRIISSRRYRFTGFWIVKPDAFVVVSRKNEEIPLLRPLAREELRRLLVESEGEDGWQSREWRDGDNRQ